MMTLTQRRARLMRIPLPPLAREGDGGALERIMANLDKTHARQIASGTKPPSPEQIAEMDAHWYAMFPNSAGQW
jgi:hypothetical protein